MAERWQQWMPFHIDRFRGSPDVQAMHPAARMGFLYLLASAWQTDDCTLSADPIDLATASGLGDELWAIYGPRVIRKFELTDGRLRNAVEFAEWGEAKKVYDERRRRAIDAVGKRKPHRDDMPPPKPPHRDDMPTQEQEQEQEQEQRGNKPTPFQPSVTDQANLASRKVMLEAPLSGMKVQMAVEQSARHAIIGGSDPIEVAENMLESWREFKAAGAKLEYLWGAEKFFGEGNWNNKEAWPWKPGCAPKVPSKPTRTALDLIREQEAADART